MAVEKRESYCVEAVVAAVPSLFLCQVLSHEELRETLAKENAPLMQARASYDFHPQSDRELQFRKVPSPPHFNSFH